LIKIETLAVKTTKVEICKVVTKVFENFKIGMKKIVAITTDGAQNMVGIILGLKSYLQIISAHCFLSLHYPPVSVVRQIRLIKIK
jgi:hypothetical protein